ncbi:MAG: hypothetical protein J6D21_08760 [Clostridia bacterium]|nr:hypothetical protein [Clostridia bacterium]
MKKLSSVLWGIALVAVGLLLGLRVFGVIEFEIFFDGWWTLFIIVPCLIGFFTDRDKWGNLIGVGIGAFLLLCCQNVLDFSLLWKLLPAALVVIVGIRLILGGLRNNNATKVFESAQQSGAGTRESCATFSSCNLNFDGQTFDGAELTAVFGGVKCDLRHAIIDKDCAIKATAVFGGIDILVPDNVTIKIESTSIFGGVENKSSAGGGTVTLYVGGTCLFGGVTVK